MKHQAMLSLLAFATLFLALAGCGDSTVRTEMLTEKNRAELMRVAASNLEVVLSYDVATLEVDLAEADKLTAGSFKNQYISLLSGSASQTIVRTKASSTAAVVNVGTVDPDPDRPVLLAFVRQTTTSSKLSTPRLDFAALELTMTRSDDEWRIDAMRKVVPPHQEGDER